MDNRPNLVHRYVDLGLHRKPLPSWSDGVADSRCGTPNRLFQRPAPRLGVLAWLGGFLGAVYDREWTPPTVEGTVRYDRETWIAALANVMHVVSDPDCDESLATMTRAHAWSALAWTSDECTLTYALLAGALEAIAGNTHPLAFSAANALNY